MVSCRTVLECTSGFRGCLEPAAPSRGLCMGDAPMCCAMLPAGQEPPCMHSQK